MFRNFSNTLFSNVNSWLLSIIILLFVGSVSVILSYLITKIGYEFGVAFLGILIGFPLLIVTLLNPRTGFIIITFASFLIYTLIRLKPTIPFGTLIDLLLFVGFIGTLIALKTNKNYSNLGFLKSPVTIVYLVWALYQFLQVLNPNANGIGGWIFGIRSFGTAFCSYFIAFHVFNNLKYIKQYTYLWLSLALAVALYGLKQQATGFADFEMNWLMLNPKVYGLSTIGGIERRFSILADVSAFGIFMAFSAVFSLSLLLGKLNIWLKFFVFLLSVIMLFSMTFSYTRTAFAMVPIGLVMMSVLTITQPRTILFVLVGFTMFVILIFGPFYSGPINRIRSTFRPSADASYNVRDINRSRIQPYIQTHPFGGGPFSTGTLGEKYHPGHVLAGFPPDNGYLRIALEYGYIGLILYLTMYATVLITATRNYFLTKDNQIKMLYLAYIASFYAISVANFVQVVEQFPISLIMGSFYALSDRLIKQDTE